MTALPRLLTAIIAIVNRKGGVGKTTTCFNLAAAFAALGKSVLVVDLDPQTNLTDGFFGEDREPWHPDRTAAALFTTSLVPRIDPLIHATPIPGVSILPGHSDLEEEDLPLTKSPTYSLYFLRSSLEPLTSRFDIILIDCRPTLARLTHNALYAAGFVLVPFQPEQFGANGMPYIQQIVAEAAAGPNPRLRLLGFLLNEVQANTQLHTGFQTSLHSHHPKDLLNVTIPRSIRYPEAVLNNMPIRLYAEHAPPNKRESARTAAKVMDDLAAELLSRIQLITEQGPPDHPPEHVTTKAA